MEGAFLVMVSRLQKVNLIVPNQVNDTVFLRQPSGPGAWGKILERFGFADSNKRVAQNGLDQVKHPDRQLAVSFHPETQVFDKLRLEHHLSCLFTQDQPHAVRHLW
jgi:hypothetical protein